METKKAITIRKDTQIRSYSLGSPQQLKAMALVLKDHIKSNQLSVNIVGRDYVMVEGWQFAGGLLGIMPRIVDVVDLSKEGEVKWKATAEIVEVKTGKIISTGFAVCSSKEAKKKGFDEYAILSMAQTRAIGKAYRNVIGWVVKMAGYEATPSEEAGAVDKPAPSETYTKALTLIAKMTDLKELEKARENIAKSKLYAKDQREQLLRIIDERINAIKNKKA